MKRRSILGGGLVSAIVAAHLLIAPFSASAASGGWADVPGVTGGSGGTTVTVSTTADLITYATATASYVIRVQGTISLSSTLDVKSNKTIEGVDVNSTIDGEMRINTGMTNVIIRNLNITNDRTVGTGDGVRILGSRNIWVDHCTVFDCDDGGVDVTGSASYVTVSWCKFYYTRNNNHNFANLIGGSDSDNTGGDTYRITFHHNWWTTGCMQRMPADRFGPFHLYNNFWDCTGNDYCSTARNVTEMLAEHNYYKNVHKPLAIENNGKLKTVGIIFDNCTGSQTNSNDAVFTPPYAYTLDATLDVPSLVMAGAGNNGGSTPPPDTTPPAAPTGLSATAGNATVGLDWADNAESDLASYNVKRSTTSGGPYSSIATGVTTSAYTDNNVSNGTTYYYVVSAVDTSSNESANSAQVSATPSAPAGSTMHVADIQVDRVNLGAGQSKAQAVVTIVDNNGSPVANATVTVDFTEAIIETKSGVTDGNGIVTITTNGSAGNPAKTTGCVSNVTHASLTYNAAANVKTCDKSY